MARVKAAHCFHSKCFASVDCKMDFVWLPLMTSMDAWNLLELPFADNGSTYKPMGRHVAPTRPS